MSKMVTDTIFGLTEVEYEVNRVLLIDTIIFDLG